MVATGCDRGNGTELEVGLFMLGNSTLYQRRSVSRRYPTQTDFAFLIAHRYRNGTDWFIGPDACHLNTSGDRVSNVHCFYKLELRSEENGPWPRQVFRHNRIQYPGSHASLHNQPTKK
jgi:hypothetical protein